MEKTRAVLSAGVVAVALSFSHAAWAQASAIPTAQGPAQADSSERGRVLLNQMVTALGGDAWRNRRDWTFFGKNGSFYKGQPTEAVLQFEEYHRVEPYATRIIVITRFGVFIPTDHRDIVELWTPDNGYEINYKGKKELPKDDVADYERRRVHSIDAVMSGWLKEPGVVVVSEGSGVVARKLVDKVTVVNAKNDAVTIELDQVTHLPVSRTFEYRDATFKDIDTDREEYDDYHDEQGVMTPLTVTRYRNGDMTNQRFYTSVKYNTGLSPELFDTEKALVKKK